MRRRSSNSWGIQRRGTVNEPDEFISKGRLDAFTDGVFAFAMTLLVVNLDLPQDSNPTTGDELLAALARLEDTFVAYVITFFVLALFWLGRARTKEEPETASGAYAWTVLSHLFFVTVLPFSMVIAGRYDLVPAIWIYGGNMIAREARVLAGEGHPPTNKPDLVGVTQR